MNYSAQMEAHYWNRLLIALESSGAITAEQRSDTLHAIHKNNEAEYQRGLEYRRAVEKARQAKPWWRRIFS